MFGGRKNLQSLESERLHFLILRESRSSILRALAARQIKESVPCSVVLVLVIVTCLVSCVLQGEVSRWIVGNR